MSGELKIASPCYDYSFRELLTPKDDVRCRLLLSFLNSLFYPDAHKITKVEPAYEFAITTEKNKKNFFDISCTCTIGSDKEFVDVEMQRSVTTDFYKRMNCYGCMVYGTQLARGKPYRDLNAVEVVAIMNEVLDDNHDVLFRQKVIIDDINPSTFEIIESKEAEEKTLSCTFIQLPKLKKQDSSSSTCTLLDWLHLFNVEREGLPVFGNRHLYKIRKDKFTNSDLAKAVEILGEIGASEAYFLEAEKETDVEMKEHSIRADGIDEGVKKEQIRLIGIHKDRGKKLDEIAEILGMEIDAVKRIDEYAKRIQVTSEMNLTNGIQDFPRDVLLRLLGMFGSDAKTRMVIGISERFYLLRKNKYFTFIRRTVKHHFQILSCCSKKITIREFLATFPVGRTVHTLLVNPRICAAYPARIWKIEIQIMLKEMVRGHPFQGGVGITYSDSSQSVINLPLSESDDSICYGCNGGGSAIFYGGKKRVVAKEHNIEMGDRLCAEVDVNRRTLHFFRNDKQLPFIVHLLLPDIFFGYYCSDGVSISFIGLQGRPGSTVKDNICEFLK